MKNKLKISVKLSILTILIGLILYLIFRDNDSIIEFQNKDIPATAIWTGGSDGGYFVEIPSAKNNEIRMRTYWYSTGLEIDANTLLMDYTKNNYQFALNNIIVRKDKKYVYVIPLNNQCVDTNINISQISTFGIDSLKSNRYFVDSPKDFDRFLQCAFYDFSNNFTVIKRNKSNVLLQVIIYPLLNDNEINQLIRRIIVKNNLSVSYD